MVHEKHFGKNVFVARMRMIRVSIGEMGHIAGYYAPIAKRAFTLADVPAQKKNVKCRKDSSIIDDLFGAYKDIDHVME